MNEHGNGGWGGGPPGSPGGTQPGGTQPGGAQPGGTQPGSPSWDAAPYGQPPGNAPGPYPIVHQPYGYQQQAYGHGYPNQAPAAYRNAGIMMLISGIKGALMSFVWIVSLIWVCVGAFWFVTLAGSILEIVYGAMMMSGKPVQNPRAIAIVGIVNGVLCFNIIGVALEAVALSQMSRPEFEQYIAPRPS